MNHRDLVRQLFLTSGKSIADATDIKDLERFVEKFRPKSVGNKLIRIGGQGDAGCGKRQADDVRHYTWIGYQTLKPDSTFRRVGINYNHWTAWDFQGNHNYLQFNTNNIVRTPFHCFKFKIKLKISSTFFTTRISSSTRKYFSKLTNLQM